MTERNNRLLHQIPKLPPLAGKPNKYGAQRTEVDGIKFASKREARRYGDLKIAQAAGAIRDLRLQVRYSLEVNGAKLGSYVADFVYHEDGSEVVEDCKGHRTALYKWKRKHMLAQYGVEIRET